MVKTLIKKTHKQLLGYHQYISFLYYHQRRIRKEGLKHSEREFNFSYKQYLKTL